MAFMLESGTEREMEAINVAGAEVREKIERMGACQAAEERTAGSEAQAAAAGTERLGDRRDDTGSALGTAAVGEEEALMAGGG